MPKDSGAGQGLTAGAKGIPWFAIYFVDLMEATTRRSQRMYALGASRRAVGGASVGKQRESPPSPHNIPREARPGIMEAGGDIMVYPGPDRTACVMVPYGRGAGRRGRCSEAGIWRTWKTLLVLLFFVESITGSRCGVVSPGGKRTIPDCGERVYGRGPVELEQQKRTHPGQSAKGRFGSGRGNQT